MGVIHSQLSISGDSGGLLYKLYFLISASEHGNSQFRVIRETAEALHFDFPILIILLDPQ